MSTLVKLCTCELNICKIQYTALQGCYVEQSLFAEIKEEGFYKASTTSSVLQIAVFTQECESLLSCALVCSAALSM